jgi:NAD(P)H-dependent flavin oxidoreductase YrpB (nitropropane dioxygenase family)
MAGQIAGLVDRERSAKEIVEEVMADAEKTIRALNQRIRR